MSNHPHRRRRNPKHPTFEVDVGGLTFVVDTRLANCSDAELAAMADQVHRTGAVECECGTIHTPEAITEGLYEARVEARRRLAIE